MSHEVRKLLVEGAASLAVSIHAEDDKYASLLEPIGSTERSIGLEKRVADVGSIVWSKGTALALEVMSL